jgi:hypothetical protein
MFGFAAICWAIWTARNRVCFDKVHIKHPYELIFSACQLMQYRTGLYATVDQAMIRNGVATMMKITTELLKKNQMTQAPRRITQGDDTESAEMDEEEDGVQQVPPDA